MRTEERKIHERFEILGSLLRSPEILLPLRRRAEDFLCEISGGGRVPLLDLASSSQNNYSCTEQDMRVLAGVPAHMLRIARPRHPQPTCRLGSIEPFFSVTRSITHQGHVIQTLDESLGGVPTIAEPVKAIQMTINLVDCAFGRLRVASSPKTLVAGLRAVLLGHEPSVILPSWIDVLHGRRLAIDADEPSLADRRPKLEELPDVVGLFVDIFFGARVLAEEEVVQALQPDTSTVAPGGTEPAWVFTKAEWTCLVSELSSLLSSAIWKVGTGTNRATNFIYPVPSRCSSIWFLTFPKINWALSGTFEN